jgi:uncharacterized protein (TIGR02421 family)
MDGKTGYSTVGTNSLSATVNYSRGEGRTKKAWKKVVKENLNTISKNFIESICTHLADNNQVRRTLPGGGRVHIDRQLPFLCIYRQRKAGENALSKGLITGEASYLTARENRKQHQQLSLLVKSIAATLKESFGSFLIVEVWVSAAEVQENERTTYKGAFKIIKSKKTGISSAIESLERSLKNIKIRKERADVEIVVTSKTTPPGLPAIMTHSEAAQLGYHIIGIEVSPIYLSKENGEVFPMMYRKLRRGFARALKNCFFEFTRTHTQLRPPHFQSLGRRSMVKAVWEADRQLAEICNGFSFLLQVTPVNNDTAWLAFQRNRFEKAPQFEYRPLSLDPALAKRRLFQIPIERIEDPTLAQLFREQQLELDRKFTMLIDRNSPRFLYGSLQLFGGVEDSLFKLAQELLEKLSPRSRDEPKANSIDAKAFAVRAEQELDYYRKTLPDMGSKVIVREDITGLMVSQGNLLIGKRTKIPAARVEALIAHEVGTHVLTYLNGKSQRLQQLHIGFPGYDELQEGLAVLSEYMLGGLTGSRMRLLAARVVATRLLIGGASFVEVFQELNKVYGFARRTAFNICTRTFRGRGLTKDAIYLRGLVKLLEYLEKGGELEPLYVGKFSANHVALIKELEWRQVLHPAPLRPAYFEDPKTIEKLTDLRNGLTLINLIKK